MIKCYINGKELDLDSGNFETKKSIANLFLTASTKSSSATGLEFSETPRNKNFFGYFEQVGTTGANDLRVGYPIEVFQDYARIFSGTFYFKGAKKVKGVTTYIGTAIGNEKTLFERLGETKLNELDWSALDHAYNNVNAEASWNILNRGTGYLYPFIDYGDFPQGSPLQPDNSIVSADYLRPAIYLNEYLKRIFAFAGFQVESNFLYSEHTNPYFLRCAFREIQIDSALLLGSTFYVRTDGVKGVVITGGSPSTGNTPLDIATPNPPYFNGTGTPANVPFNLTTYIFTAPNSRTYKFSFVVNIDRGASWDKDLWVIFDLFVNGSSQGNYVEALNVKQYANLSASYDVALNAGDTVELKYIVSRSIGQTGNPSDLLFTAEMQSQIVNPQIGFNDIVPMVNTVSKTFTCAQLLKGVIDYFNLIVYQKDSELPILTIEPKDAIYKQLPPTNFIEKADTFEYEVESFASQVPSNVKIKPKQGNSYYSKIYSQRNGIVYGEKEHIPNFDALGAPEVIELPFVFEPPVTTSIGWAIPRVYNIQNGIVADVADELGLFYYGGLMTPIFGNFEFAGVPRTSYPYCGHTNDQFNATLDILPATPKEIYYNILPINAGSAILKYSNNNIFNRLHRETYISNEAQGARGLQVFLNLKPFEFDQLKLTTEVYLFNRVWRISEIIYNENNTARATLVRVEDVPTFVYESNFYNGRPIGDEVTPFTATIKLS